MVPSLASWTEVTVSGAPGSSRRICCSERDQTSVVPSSKPRSRSPDRVPANENTDDANAGSDSTTRPSSDRTVTPPSKSPCTNSSAETSSPSRMSGMSSTEMISPVSKSSAMICPVGLSMFEPPRRFRKTTPWSTRIACANKKLPGRTRSTSEV